MSGVGAGLAHNQRDLLFVDLETSGVDPDRHEIIEAAAIRTSPRLDVERGRFDRRCRLVHPERADSEALRINRYSDWEWRHAGHLRLVLADLATLLGNEEVIVMGYNVLEFDWRFLKNAYVSEGMSVPKPRLIIDIMSMAWPLCARGLVDKISLDSLCAKYGIANDGHHRAMPDVKRLMALYKKIMGIP